MAWHQACQELTENSPSPTGNPVILGNLGLISPVCSENILLHCVRSLQVNTFHIYFFPWSTRPVTAKKKKLVWFGMICFWQIPDSSFSSPRDIICTYKLKALYFLLSDIKASLSCWCYLPPLTWRRSVWLNDITRAEVWCGAHRTWS